ncbi:MAG: hypothetical protein HY814_01345 [Candidatus Riflebacteria bacterium]|nr:hypothetical protein [Candidatus Riflebacteria bacterium]
MARETSTTVRLDAEDVEARVSGAMRNDCFDPRWRDDVFTPAAVAIPLVLPPPTAPEGDLWVTVKTARTERAFGRTYDHGFARPITAVVKRTGLPAGLVMKDQQGRSLPADHPALSFLLPAKAWMSDALEERCSMLAAARLARGTVLVGGLGLALYPQYVLHLHRPVGSLTIVEREPRIIRLITARWPRASDLAQCSITIVEDSVEHFLETTRASYDTVFLDTWEDSDPRLLAQVNHLIGLARRRCVPGGQLHCWSYALMVAAAQREALALARTDFPWDQYRLDPVLAAFAKWFARQSRLTPRKLARKLWTLATTVASPASSYEPERCFCALAPDPFLGILGASLARLQR